MHRNSDNKTHPFSDTPEMKISSLVLKHFGLSGHKPDKYSGRIDITLTKENKAQVLAFRIALHAYLSLTLVPLAHTDLTRVSTFDLWHFYNSICTNGDEHTAIKVIDDILNVTKKIKNIDDFPHQSGFLNLLSNDRPDYLQATWARIHSIIQNAIKSPAATTTSASASTPAVTPTHTNSAELPLTMVQKSDFVLTHLGLIQFKKPSTDENFVSLNITRDNKRFLLGLFFTMNNIYKNLENADLSLPVPVENLAKLYDAINGSVSVLKDIHEISEVISSVHLYVDTNGDMDIDDVKRHARVPFQRISTLAHLDQRAAATPTSSAVPPRTTNQQHKLADPMPKQPTHKPVALTGLPEYLTKALEKMGLQNDVSITHYHQGQPINMVLNPTDENKSMLVALRILIDTIQPREWARDGKPMSINFIDNGLLFELCENDKAIQQVIELSKRINVDEILNAKGELNAQSVDQIRKELRTPQLVEAPTASREKAVYPPVRAAETLHTHPMPAYPVTAASVANAPQTAPVVAARPAAPVSASPAKPAASASTATPTVSVAKPALRMGSVEEQQSAQNEIKTAEIQAAALTFDFKKINALIEAAAKQHDQTNRVVLTSAAIAAFTEVEGIAANPDIAKQIICGINDEDIRNQVIDEIIRKHPTLVGDNSFTEAARELRDDPGLIVKYRLAADATKLHNVISNAYHQLYKDNGDIEAAKSVFKETGVLILKLLDSLLDQLDFEQSNPAFLKEVRNFLNVLKTKTKGPAAILVSILANTTFREQLKNQTNSLVCFHLSEALNRAELRLAYKVELARQLMEIKKELNANYAQLRSRRYYIKDFLINGKMSYVRSIRTQLDSLDSTDFNSVINTYSDVFALLKEASKDVTHHECKVPATKDFLVRTLYQFEQSTFANVVNPPSTPPDYQTAVQNCMKVTSTPTPTFFNAPAVSQQYWAPQPSTAASQVPVRAPTAVSTHWSQSIAPATHTQANPVGVASQTTALHWSQNVMPVVPVTPVVPSPKQAIPGAVFTTQAIRTAQAADLGEPAKLPDHTDATLTSIHNHEKHLAKRAKEQEMQRLAEQFRAQQDAERQARMKAQADADAKFLAEETARADVLAQAGLAAAEAKLRAEKEASARSAVEAAKAVEAKSDITLLQHAAASVSELQHLAEGPGSYNTAMMVANQAPAAPNASLASPVAFFGNPLSLAPSAPTTEPVAPIPATAKQLLG